MYFDISYLQKELKLQNAWEGFTEEFTSKSGIWGLYYTGLPAFPLLAGMYDHCQPSFSFLMLINFGFLVYLRKRMEFSWIKHDSGNTISTRIQSLSIILKYQLLLLNYFSEGMFIYDRTKM